MPSIQSSTRHYNKSASGLCIELSYHGQKKFEIYEPLLFSDIENTASLFSKHILKNYEALINILLRYETFEVATDEIERTLDLFINLNENKNYFEMRIGAVASFLPKNQPLYALSCFVIIPSLMSTEVHFRIPHCMKFFFHTLLEVLNLKEFFPNILISQKERLEFLEERAALRINEITQETMPITQAVIFTGTSNHAEQLRVVFDKRTLFIANGSGHNPIVITEEANIKNALKAVLKLQLYNQGQDCAAPNSILVHKNVYESFMAKMRKAVTAVIVGPYQDRASQVGPITDPSELIRLQQLLVENREWIDSSTEGLINSKQVILRPTIICKPLKKGGNYDEVFAPIFFVQMYESDEDLSLYFEDQHYARNAMYISVYGSSGYVNSLIGKLFAGKILHDKQSILHDTHLHEKGIERGTQPYGGNGYAASSISINGQITCKATLPQRDIHNEIVRPLLDSNLTELKIKSSRNMKKIITKDVSKMLRIKTAKTLNIYSAFNDLSYIDLAKIDKEKHYFRLDPKDIFVLLDKPNIAFISNLHPSQLSKIRILHKFLSDVNPTSINQISDFLYSITKRTELSQKDNKAQQLIFFKQLYQLLFAKEYGPRLASFLAEADKAHILSLIDV